MEKIHDKLLKFSTLRPRSEKEIKGWFKRKNVPSDVQEKLLNKLMQLNLLNDLEFAKWWVDQRNSFSPRGRKLLKMELVQKGVKKEVIEEVLEGISLDEVEVAYLLALKKKSLVEKLPDENTKRKLIGYLGRKGFNWETIDAVLSKMVKYESGD